MKVAKKYFYQLTQRCDNGLFMKKWHANTQSDRLTGNVFIS